MDGEAPACVPIIGGTGALGFALGLRLAQAGVPVALGSRDRDRASVAATRLREAVPGGGVEGMTNAEAATAGPVVFVCVPFASHRQTLSGLTEALTDGQVIVDATVPLATAVGGRPTQILGVPEGSAAEQARALLPAGVAVTSALHSVSAARLGDPEQALDEDVPLVGDAQEAKGRVAALIARIPGLRPVDAGGLGNARLIEGLTPLLIAVNQRNRTRAGMRFSGLDPPRW